MSVELQEVGSRGPKLHTQVITNIDIISDCGGRTVKTVGRPGQAWLRVVSTLACYLIMGDLILIGGQGTHIECEGLG